SQGFPFISASFAPVDAEFAVEGEVLAVTLDGYNVNCFWLVSVYVNYTTKICGQVAADFFPVVAGVVRAHDVPVLLHEERARTLRMHGDVVHTVSDFCVRVRNVLRAQALVDGLPGRAAVIGAESPRGGDGDINSLWIFRIKNDGVQAHSARARLPLGAGAVSAQAGKFLPIFAAVGGAEQARVFHARVNGVRIGERGLEMPHPLELPGMLGAVVPLMRGERRGGRVIGELVAGGFWRAGRDGLSFWGAWLMPGFAAIVGALDDLAKPSAGL